MKGASSHAKKTAFPRETESRVSLCRPARNKSGPGWIDAIGEHRGGGRGGPFHQILRRPSSSILPLVPLLPLSLYLSAATPTSSCPRLRSLYNGNRESQMAIYASLVSRRSRPSALLLSCVPPGGYKRARSFRLSRIWFIGWLARVRNLGNRDSQFGYKINVFSNTIPLPFSHLLVINFILFHSSSIDDTSCFEA